MKFRDENGRARWSILMWAVLIAAYAVNAIADTYRSTGIQGLVFSATNGAIVSETFNVKPAVALPSYNAGDVWCSSASNAFKCLPVGWTSAQGFANILTTNTTPSDLVSNPTANTSFTTTFPVPADALTAGKKLRIHARGFYSTGLAANANLSFTMELGPSGQQMATTGNVSTTSGTSSAAWEIDSEIQVYTAGASGTLVNSVKGNVNNGAALTDASKIGRYSGAIDTTVVNTLAIDVKVSASDASSSAKLEQLTIEQLN